MVLWGIMMSRTETPLRRLRLVLLVAPPLFLLAWGWYSWSARVAAARDAALNGAVLGRAYFERILDAQQAVLLHVDRLISGKSLEEIGSSPEIAAELARMDKEMPYTAIIGIIDPEGRLIMSSNTGPTSLDLSQRDYVKALQKNHQGLFVGGRFSTLRNGVDSLAVARHATRGPPGVIISAPVRVEVLADFFARLAPHPEHVGSLLRDDGMLLVRRDARQAPIRLPPDAPALAAIRQGDTGFYHAYAASDGIERTYAFARVGGFPLVVNYGVAMNSLRWGWAQELALVTAVLGAFVLLSLMLIGKAEQVVAQGRAHADELERRVDERTAALHEALQHKEMLIREVHHRVTNNLAIVASLLRTQARSNPELAQPMAECASRVHAIAALHSLFYKGKNLETVPFREILEALARQVSTATGTTAEIRVDGDDTRLDLDRATQLALLANELVTNSLKHAFPDGGGRIQIDFRSVAQSIQFSVSDNGVGLRDEGQAAASLGMRLIRMFAASLNGKLEVVNGAGAAFRLTIPIEHKPDGARRVSSPSATVSP